MSLTVPPDDGASVPSEPAGWFVPDARTAVGTEEHPEDGDGDQDCENNEHCGHRVTTVHWV